MIFKQKNKENGITLIALVVTIIVLLILAGVTISMITGDNGILKRANEAKEETQRTTEDEQRKMAMLEATMNTENTEFQGITIPAGFAPTRMPGESTVEEGLVITDSEGNEFVWVPVPKAIGSVNEKTQINCKENDTPMATIENENEIDPEKTNYKAILYNFYPGDMLEVISYENGVECREPAIVDEYE